MKTKKTNKVSKALSKLLLLALLVMTMSNTVYAAEGPFTLTFENSTEGVTYKAYQIFAGTASGDKLTDIEWGTGVTEQAKTMSGEAAAVADTLTTYEAVTAFVETVVDSGYLSSTVAGTSTGPVDGKYTIADLPAGYYLVQDGTTTYTVQVIDDVTAKPKTEIASFEKKVQDTNDSTDAAVNAQLQDSADYDIGDHVPFTLTAVLPEAGDNGYEQFDHYYLSFSDDLADGFTLDTDSFVVYVNSVAPENVIEDSYYTVGKNGADADDFALTFTDLVQVPNVNGGDKIIVTYTATLNENAVIGNAGNLNSATLTYLSKPNVYDGTNFAALPEDAKGTTPADVVSVYTYELLVDKIDSTNVALEGATFTLYKYDAEGTGTEVDTAIYGDTYANYYEVATLPTGPSFTFSGLDDGQYVLIETVTPEGYNSIDPIEFEITAEHTEEADIPALTALTVSNASFTASLDGTLDATKLDGSTKDLSSGQIFTEVVNKMGATLPSTGGIGTTLFYLVGGILFVGAVVLLVTKKRADSQQLS